MRKILRQPGLELTPDYEVATPTLVYCLSMSDYQTFVHACSIRHGVRNQRVRFISDASNDKNILRGMPASWAHIAFLGIDPRTHSGGAIGGSGGAWWEIDRLRLKRQFRRAFLYPEWAPAYIIPNIMEGERDW